jgi:molybdate transport system regulatory protein
VPGKIIMTPVIRFRIDFTKSSFVGPGKIELLEAIRKSGSLSQAARDLGMSYRRAWLLVDSLKSSFREPATLASKGGRGGGGIALTTFGERLISSYRAIESEIAEVAARRLKTVTPAVIKRGRSKPAASRRRLVRSIAPGS